MKEYTFSGEVTLRGVTFFVKAKNEAEAKEKAARGEYDDYEANGAETSDWDMNPATIKLNE
jgi:hypothetical protein